MAELKIYLSDGLNDRFRRIAMSVHGYGRGSLSKAAEEALAKWCSEHEPSALPKETVERSNAMQGQLKQKAETHIDPDERESSIQGARSVGENGSSIATGSST